MKTISIILILTIFSGLIRTFGQEKIDPINTIELGVGWGGRYYDEQTGPNGYKTHNESIHVFSINYLHLWGISKKIYAGFGSGYHHINVGHGWDTENVIINGMEYEKEIKTPGTTYHFIPIFGQARYYFRNNPESAFLTADIGSFLKLDHNEGKPRLFWGLGFGQRYKINSSKFISWGIDYHEHYLFRKTQGFDEPNENPRIASLALKIGLIF